MSGGAEKGRRSHAMRLLGVVAGMFAFGFALVPLYDVICDLTGLNGRIDNQPSTAAASPVDPSRWVTIEFLTTVNNNGDWEFRAEQPSVRVHPGEATQVMFYARNLRDQTVTAQAVPSIAPGRAARHIHKTECFCFRQQEFQPEEGRDMPVVFSIDPELPADVDTMTLSYTFFDINQTAQAQ